jgi:toxin HigB-1
VDLSFASRKLEKLCTHSREATKVLGADVSRKLASRLADLLAAETAAELAVGRPHPLTGDRAGQFAVDLAGGVRLVFRPRSPAPLRPDGAVAWERVSSVEIVFIGDYHD